MVKKSPQEVLKNLTELISKKKSKGLTVTMVKKMVENEDGDPKVSVNNYVMKTMKGFQNKKSVDELNKIVGIFMDFWNYWPHKSLGNKSPSDLITKEMEKHEKCQSKIEDTKVRVGNTEMSWDKYELMLKRMEETQKPFKKWLNEKFKPDYFTYLKNMYSKRVYETRRDVCDLFFDRCLYLGFTDLEKIRPEYAIIEFPFWWQTHVMWGSLSETRISGYIEDMFVFIYDKYGREVGGLFEIRKEIV
ncbi:MAG TPA: hypothetical protein DEQ03_03390 [Marinilabiliales bacterium]|nr:hypothetical protein [Marinilabiliales bacterium]